MKELSLKVNDVLSKLFDDAGLLLVDFKLEFGVFHDGSIVLGERIQPGRLPPVGQGHQEEDGQGPLPPRPR